MFKNFLRCFTFKKPLNKKFSITPTWKKIQKNPSQLPKQHGDCIDHGY